MKIPTNILFIIDADPRKSGRVAEAVRIAAGVGAWKKVLPSVYLRGESVLALAEDADGLIDQEIYDQFLPSIPANGGAIYVQAGNPHLSRISPVQLHYQSITAAELSEVCARHQYVTRFTDSRLDARLLTTVNEAGTALTIQNSGFPICERARAGAMPDYNRLLEDLFAVQCVHVG